MEYKQISIFSKSKPIYINLNEHNFPCPEDSLKKLYSNQFRIDTTSTNPMQRVCFENCFQLRTNEAGFLGGAVVKNPPANAGDMGSSPGPGRSHMSQSN